MAFEPKTFTFILQRMANRLVARSKLTDVVTGGGLWNTLAACAREVDDAYFQMTNLQDAWDLDTAKGDELELRAADIPDGALVRLGALKSTTILVFSRTGTTGSVTIPIGTVSRVPGGGPAFLTTAAGSIADASSSSGSIATSAQEAGAAGNVNAATITQLDGLAGVETVTNTVAATGGQDKETDAQLLERIRNYVRSLPRGTPDALKFAALSVNIDDTQRVTTAQVEKNPANQVCKVHVYIDDGLGTAETSANLYGSPETIIASAVGGEKRFNLGNFPIHESFAITVKINAVTKVRNVDYRLDPTTALVILDETLFPTGLAATDVVIAEYTFYTGLIALTQKTINGDPNDRPNFPGYSSAGDQVFVLAPSVTQLAIVGTLTPDPEFTGDIADLKKAVTGGLSRYVNGLDIGADVIRTELIHKAQAVPGVRDIDFTNPTGNISVGVGELARVQDANISLT